MAYDVWSPQKNKSRRKSFADKRHHQLQPRSEPSKFPNDVLRVTNLRRFMETLNLSIEELSSRLEIPSNRVRDYLQERVSIGNETAMHIEEILSLTPCWLDQPNAPIPGHVMLDMPSTSAPPPLSEKANVTNDSMKEISLMTEESVERLPKELSSEKHSVSNRQSKLEARRANLIMLTQQRGSKNQLAVLSDTTPSRISLMASGRKPVSDPFADGIERGINVPQGWLDFVHVKTEVPDSVWNLLRVDGDKIDERANPKAKVASAPQATNVKKKAIAGNKGAPVTQPIMPNDSSTLFVKNQGETGPIAIALSKTVLRLSAEDRLSEEQAFHLLGMLFDIKR